MPASSHHHPPLRLAAVALAALAALLLVVACGGGSSGPRPVPTVVDPFSGGYPTYRDAASGITAILGTPDLGVGSFRVAVALSDRSGLIRFPAVAVETYYYGRDSGRAGGTPEGPVQRAEASFFVFPDGGRGLYTAALSFDRAGTWGLLVAIPRPEGAAVPLMLTFPVAARASAPTVGDPVPASRNRTARDVTSLAQLSTGSDPQPALYGQTVAEALAARRPFVVVFASPAFCTNPLCGPQVEELGLLAQRYAGRAGFIHIDLYEHPDQIKGDLARAVRSPILQEWGLHSDEWTFVVGADGRVVARFEAFVPADELEAALQRALAVS